MANWSNGSLRAGQKIRNSQGGDQNLSKVVELNGTYRLFFPTFIAEYDVLDDEGNPTGEKTKQPDIRAVVVPGRTGNMDMIGTGFVPYKDDMYTVDPITEKFKDVTPLEDWARIARILFEAGCVRAKKNAETEAQRSAQELGRPIDSVALSKTLEDIEEKYHGGKTADGKNIPPSENPALSGSIVFKVSTRVLVVRMNSEDKPDWKNAKYAVFEISKARAEELTRLLDNPKYFRGSYLEVSYAYVGADKKTAGQNAKLGYVVASDSLEESFPDEWKSVGKGMVEKIVVGNAKEQVDFLRSRNRAFSGNRTPNDIISAYKKWCSTNQAVFGSIDFTDESVSRSATLFLENHLVDSMPKQLAEFQRLAEESKNKSAGNSDDNQAVEETVEQAQETVETVVPDKQEEVDEVAAAKAMQMFTDGNAENQTLRKLAEQTPNIDISAGDDDLGDL